MEWDKSISCDKIKIETDNMTICGGDGSSFRTAIGNFVPSHPHA